MSEELGSWRLREVLGEGGMGVVYRAEHVETGQQAALKTLTRARARLLEGLRHEIRALSHVEHPNIVRVLDHGVTDDGVPWYAMELLQGLPLRHLLVNPHHRPTRAADAERTAGAASWWSHTLVPDEGTAAGEFSLFSAVQAPAAQGRRWRPSLELRLAPESGHDAGRRRGSWAQHKSWCEPMAQLCLTLSCLHGEGLVHRDLKPDNMLLLPDGRLMLIDFGLAREAFVHNVYRERIDVNLQITGTPPYMAPEQFQGRWIDARTDLYALGCILYELLTGLPPFIGDPSAVMQGHLSHSPSPPSRWVPDLPPPLGALILGLLAKDPADRPGHADLIAETLLACADPPMDVPLLRETHHLPTARSRLYRPQLVGQSQRFVAQLLQLAASLQTDRPSGGLVILQGERGLGRSRLLIETIQRLHQDRDIHAQLYSGECLLEGLQDTSGGLGAAPGTPLQPLRPLLQQLADQCREEGPETTRLLLGKEALVLAPLIPELASLPGLEACPPPAPLSTQDEHQQRVALALITILDRLVAYSPVVLALDDLQKADDWSLVWLVHLTRRFQQQPDWPLLVIATVCTTTPLEEFTFKRLQEILPTARTTLTLERLSRDETGLLLGSMLALPEPPAAWTDFLTRVTEGVPLFITEYLSVTVELGHFFRDPRGRWSAREDFDFDAAFVGGIPALLVKLTQERLAHYSAGAFTLLGVLSAIGRQGPLDLLTESIEGDIVEPLNELLRNQVLDWVDDGRSLRFRHSIVRDSVYHDLKDPFRRTVHEALAATINKRPADKQNHKLLGYHWAQADQPSLATYHYTCAGKFESERGDARSARWFFERALEQVEAARQDERLSFQGDEGVVLLSDFALVARRGLADTTFAQGEHLLAMDLYTTLYREATGLERWALALQALFSLVGAAQASGQPALARRWERELQTFLAAHPPDAASYEQGQLAYTTAVNAFQQGHLNQARASAEQALRLFEDLPYPPAVGPCLDLLGSICGRMGQPARAARYYARAIDLHRQTGARINESNTLRSWAQLCLSTLDLDTAGTLLQQALALHRDMDQPWGHVDTLRLLGKWHTARREHTLASERLEEALSLSHSLDSNQMEARILLDFGHALAAQERYLEAIEHFQTAQELFGKLGDFYTWGHTALTIATNLLVCGRFDEALERYQATLAHYLAHGNQHGAAWTLGHIADTHRRLGQLDLARPCVLQALEHIETLAPGSSRHGALLVNLALITLASGDLEGAERLQTQARALHIQGAPTFEGGLDALEEACRLTEAGKHHLLHMAERWTHMEASLRDALRRRLGLPPFVDAEDEPEEDQ